MLEDSEEEDSLEAEFHLPGIGIPPGTPGDRLSREDPPKTTAIISETQDTALFVLVEHLCHGPVYIPDSMATSMDAEALATMDLVWAWALVYW